MVLRPLQDLWKQITQAGKTFEFYEILGEDYAHLACLLLGQCEHDTLGDAMGSVFEALEVAEISINDLPFGLIQRMIEHHFDVNGLIEKGLSVSFHDFNKPVY